MILRHWEHLVDDKADINLEPYRIDFEANVTEPEPEDEADLEADPSATGLSPTQPVAVAEIPGVVWEG